MTTVGFHIATVRKYDPLTGVATVVVPSLYGDVAVDAWPFTTTPTTAADLPTLDPGNTVIAFYDGGDPLTILRWFLGGSGAAAPPDVRSPCDNFERTELGADWVEGPKIRFGAYTTVIENALDNGAWVAGENNHPYPDAVLGSIRTTAAYPGTQSISAKISNLFPGHDPSVAERYQWMESEQWLFTQVVGGSSNACLGVYVIIQVNQGPGNTGGCYMQLVQMAADGTLTYFDDNTYAPLTGWQSNSTYTVRFDTSPDGHCTAYFEENLVVEGDLTPTGGQYVGVAQQWNRTNYASTVPNPATSPRFEEVCISVPEADQIDEVWVGPDTPPGAQELWYDTDESAFYGQIMVVKSTPPTASDFDMSSIPLNAVWVVSQ